MKAYLLDEINKKDIEKIRDFLTENATRSSLNQVFWVEIPGDLLSPLQFQHKDCGPHVFAIELGDTWVKLEFFVRSLETLRCGCADYCTDVQREHIVHFADRMLAQLGVST